MIQANWVGKIESQCQWDWFVISSEGFLRCSLPKNISIRAEWLGPGGMAGSEWMHSVRAIRDTPVADYSAPGANTKRRVVYCPLIAVSPFLLALSVSYCKQTLWLCGQLWPYIVMVSLGTSAKCKSVQTPHANLPDTPVAFTSASKHFQMLPGLPGALQSTLRLSKSILRCSWMSQFEENIELLRNCDGNPGMVWKELCHRRAERLGDAEDAARWRWNCLV